MGTQPTAPSRAVASAAWDRTEPTTTPKPARSSLPLLVSANSIEGRQFLVIGTQLVRFHGWTVQEIMNDFVLRGKRAA